ncbi:hypothetical protein AMATHDRAFT_62037 [Amanita thiersii Skay4041]|uniref:Glycoside hydrolase family 71 protein n=1 Tax=Amanita thiersii Skay4041 TaxID=703135 RepID=A0A2A9NQQ2_9AGAR|nr:hypothetical protein AMATHDRAFT_62037 [Amanita thiersii Skay4041]
MRFLPAYLQALILVYFLPFVSAQSWCGKNYMKTEPIVPPGGQFPVPASSVNPLLALRCSQTIRPYLPGDGNDSNQPVSILVDAPVIFSHISNAKAISITNTESLSVTVTVNGQVLTKGNVPLNSTKTELPFSLSLLQPRAQAYNITCTATYDSQTFVVNSLLTYLPELPSGIGSVTKSDLRTGALLARPADGSDGPFAPVFPIGFYTQFDSYLAQNLSISAELADQGFTIVHPVPTFSSQQALDEVLDKMQAAGLYLMYDMRGTYMNSASVKKQVNSIKARPNLLLWYTADEPDGTSDPLDATLTASNLITSLDGGDGRGGAGYHPVSLVLNCQDYHYTEYTSGADIVLQDAYMVGNNVTFSTVWGTVCTKDYGDCGCDNCQGAFEDISTRMDQFRDRNFINGWERTKAVWTVPQGFGNETYWKRYPTGKEWVVESIVGINHGGLGVVSWDDPTTPDIKSSASLLAKSLKQMTRFILNASASFRQVTVSRVDVGLWTVGSETLVLASNMNDEAQSVTLADLGLPSSGATTQQIMDSGSQVMAGSGFTFESVGSGAFIVSTVNPIRDNSHANTASRIRYPLGSWMIPWSIFGLF